MMRLRMIWGLLAAALLSFEIALLINNPPRAWPFLLGLALCAIAAGGGISRQR